MKLLFAMEGRFLRCGDEVYSTHLTYEGLWLRYLRVFEEIVVLARVYPAKIVPDDWHRADGPGVVFLDLPDYHGFAGYARSLSRLVHEIQAALDLGEAVIIRVPGLIGTLVWRAARRQGRPFGVEVVGDPWDVFSPGSYRSIVRPVIRRVGAWGLRAQCREAAAAAYVTQGALQRRYPPGAWSVGCSDVDLPQAAFIDEDAFASRARRWIDMAERDHGPWRLIFVGTLNQLYKAPHVVIEATAACVRNGADVELIMVGDGSYRSRMEALAARLGIGDRVKFLGRLAAGAAVRAQLDRADLFLLPSFQEGLPRAMIEAMARGLPCIGSTVGGIPELLPCEDLVSPGDASALARKICEVLSSPERLILMARRNLAKARQYEEGALSPKRVAFYEQVRQVTERWLATNKTTYRVSAGRRAGQA